MSETDARTIHRLEAFSDIVMGFALAELGINLVVPKTLEGLSGMWVPLNLFLISFLLIATLWWYHHKLFLTYFVLNPATTIMNFAMLAALALGIYFQQVAVHFFAEDVAAALPVRLWLGSMSVVYALLATMFAIGVWERRAQLDAADLRWGVNRTYRALVAAMALAAGCAIFPYVGHARAFGVAALLTFGVAALLRRFAVPAITNALLPR